MIVEAVNARFNDYSPALLFVSSMIHDVHLQIVKFYVTFSEI